MFRGGEFRPSPHQGRIVQSESQSRVASALFDTLGTISVKQGLAKGRLRLR